MAWEKEISVARQAAQKAGGELRPLLGQALEVRKKGEIDLVTEADFRAEKTIIDTIHSSFPQDSILSEEGGRHEALPGRVWLIDPLDGTINFAHALPFYAVCIGLQVEGRMVMGLVFNPEMDERFEAWKMGGRSSTVRRSGFLARQRFWNPWLPRASLTVSIKKPTPLSVAFTRSLSAPREYGGQVLQLWICVMSPRAGWTLTGSKGSSLGTLRPRP
jgi:hypothetical protein